MYEYPVIYLYLLTRVYVQYIYMLYIINHMYMLDFLTIHDLVVYCSKLKLDLTGSFSSVDTFCRYFFTSLYISVMNP